MAPRSADHRTLSERVHPIVVALQQLGHSTIMPDHPDADDDVYVHWIDATAAQLKADVEADEADSLPAAGSSLAEQHLRLQCVVGDNLRRLSDLIGSPYGDHDDVGQQLDFMVDDVIDLVQKIVKRNEELANQLEDCHTGMARARSMDKPHDPNNPVHKTITEDEVPVTGRASSRPAMPEDAPPQRPPRPGEDDGYSEPPARHEPGLSLTKQLPRRPMSGPWH